jgi:hypothetical protein
VSVLDSAAPHIESAYMRKLSLLLTAIFSLVAMAPLTAQAQSAGTYNLLAAGTSKGERGYCSIGTVTIRDDNTILITTKNPLDPLPARRYFGTITETSFSATSGRRKLSGQISYSGDKYAHGTYTAFFGSRIVGAGRFSMTRR